MGSQAQALANLARQHVADFPGLITPAGWIGKFINLPTHRGPYAPVYATPDQLRALLTPGSWSVIWTPELGSSATFESIESTLREHASALSYSPVEWNSAAAGGIFFVEIPPTRGGVS